MTLTAWGQSERRECQRLARPGRRAICCARASATWCARVLTLPARYATLKTVGFGIVPKQRLPDLIHSQYPSQHSQASSRATTGALDEALATAECSFSIGNYDEWPPGQPRVPGKARVKDSRWERPDAGPTGPLTSCVLDGPAADAIVEGGDAYWRERSAVAHLKLGHVLIGLAQHVNPNQERKKNG